ncbi:MAG: hypothetical protein ACK4VO_08745 [Pseudobdellovibrio sp.]
MNSVNFKTEKTYTKTFIKTFLFTFFYFAQVKVHAADWMIDLSRRQTDFNRIENQRMPSSNVEESANPNADKELFQAIKKIVNPVQPSQEIVIMQTETGFVPEKIYLKKNEIYKIHIVNLNSKEKNVSFLMDAFSQVHNTVFGVVKTFTIQPKVEGVYSYQSPETGALGKAVIISDSPNRKIASEKSSTK